MAKAPEVIEGRTIHDESGGYIGGSDSAAVCGQSAYRTANEKFFEFRGEWTPDRTLARSRFYFGHWLEAMIWKEYHRITGHKTTPEPGLKRHKSEPFNMAACHVDRRVRPAKLKGIVEGKSQGAFADNFGRGGEIPDLIAYPLTDEERQTQAWWTPEPVPLMEIPVDYGFQVHHNMWIWDAEWCDVPLFHMGGNPTFLIYRVQRDETIIKILEETYPLFWEMVLSNVAPDVDFAHKSTPDFLKRFYRNTTGKVIAMPVVIEALHTKYEVELAPKLKRMRAELREVEKQDKELKARMQFVLQENSVLLSESGTAWVQSERIDGVKTFRYTKNPKT